MQFAPLTSDPATTPTPVVIIEIRLPLVIVRLFVPLQTLWVALVVVSPTGSVSVNAIVFAAPVAGLVMVNRRAVVVVAPLILIGFVKKLLVRFTRRVPVPTAIAAESPGEVPALVVVTGPVLLVTV